MASPPTRLTWLLAGSCVLACGREPRGEEASESRASADVELDLGALRASLVDGLEAALEDPSLPTRLGLTRALESDAAEAALERLLVRAAEQPSLRQASDAFFAALQDSPAMREALVEYARQNPELDLEQISAGFVSHVDARLTRPELAERLELSLRARLRGTAPALARAWFVEAGGADALAAGVVTVLGTPEVQSRLAGLLGRDPAALQDRLERRLADPSRAAVLVEALAPTLAAAAPEILVAALDDPASAELLAAALARLLADPELRSRCQELFALALAPSFERARFDAVLGALLDEPAVAREAAALLAALARAPATRAAVAEQTAQFTGGPALDAPLSRALQ